MTPIDDVEEAPAAEDEEEQIEQFTPRKTYKTNSGGPTSTCSPHQSASPPILQRQPRNTPLL